MVSPVLPNADFALRKPLVKIAAMRSDTGRVLYVSSVIFDHLDAMAKDQPAWKGNFGNGQSGVACVQGYLHFCFTDKAWHAPRRQLATWFEAVCQWPSSLPPHLARRVCLE